MTTEPITKGEIVPLEDTGSRAVAMGVTPMGLIAQALANGASVETLSGLYDLQLRWETNEARKAFVVAMAAFKAEVPEITKNKDVGFKSRKAGASDTSYSHATLDNVCNTVNPALAAHGLSYRWKTLQDEKGVIQVTCIVTHTKGYFEETTLRAAADNSGNKNVIQAVGSTTTYLSRYTLLAALGLATVDEDDDGISSEGDPHSMFINSDQLAELQDGLAEANADIAKFCEWLKVDALAHLPATGFNKAMNAIAAKKKAAQK